MYFRPPFGHGRACRQYFEGRMEVLSAGHIRIIRGICSAIEKLAGMNTVTPEPQAIATLGSRLDAVTELVKGFDGGPFTKSLIRRAALRCVLHLPVNHEASEALELFYGALDRTSIRIENAKARSRAPSLSSLVRIWLGARKAIEIATNNLVRQKSDTHV